MAAPSAEEVFRRLTIGEPRLLSSIGDADRGGTSRSRLDVRTESLLRVAALVALDAPESSYRGVVDEARLAGASVDDLLGVLLAVAGHVGSARVVSAAPRIALAAGYDVEADIDRYEPEEARGGAR